MFRKKILEFILRRSQAHNNVEGARIVRRESVSGCPRIRAPTVRFESEFPAPEVVRPERRSNRARDSARTAINEAAVPFNIVVSEEAAAQPAYVSISGGKRGSESPLFTNSAQFLHPRVALWRKVTLRQV